MQDDLWILVRLAVTIVLAGAIGWDREAKGKAAGLRTHMLVGLSATLFLSLGDLMLKMFATAGDPVRSDPIRVIEATVAGISFLGAGTIFVSRGTQQVQGLTTAASLLATAAVGLAVGLERYVLAVGATVLVLVVLRAIPALGLEEPQQPEAAGPPASSAAPAQPNMPG